MRPRRIALAMGVAAVGVVGCLALSWRELAVRYHLWRLGSDPERFQTALQEAPEDRQVREALKRFVQQREGAARLIATLLRDYELSRKHWPTHLDTMDWMLLGLHRVLTGSGTVSGRTSALGRSSEVWEFLYAFVNRATGNFTAANSQYDRRVAQSSILAPALSDLLPMASGEEVDVAGLPGVRARIVSRQDAERLCEKWSRAASRFFQREHGTPAHFCLLERVSPGGE